MPPDEAIEVLRRMCEAGDSGDWVAAGDLFAPDVRFADRTGTITETEVTGRDEFFKSAARWYGGFDTYLLRPQAFLAAGDRAWARCAPWARSRSGVETGSAPFFLASQVREGLIVRHEQFFDERAALAAAGLAPGEHPLVMGIVNVTPDSFSDGGEFLDPEKAAAHARRLWEDGAAILDIGGESTRPGAEPVPEDEELRRVLPVLDALDGLPARISIDTTKAAVAHAALERGADVVNDTSALRRDPAIAGVVADAGCDCVLMHMLGEPRTMQDAPRYDDVVADVKAFLEERLAFAVAEGIAEERVWLDPGIGFGKTVEHNLELLRRLDEIAALGRPLVVGTSRKRFLGTLTGRGEGERLAGTIAANVLAHSRGAQVFRVHDVREVADALRVAAATVAAPWTRSTTTT
ncbi:MAG TPA: dihydropteroate synthase [Thermoleophilaceae bacterium]|nr:dihydropteroate synthase [Thermoleophilaceae bacterium]